jgi:hypothetical protein
MLTNTRACRHCVAVLRDIVPWRPVSGAGASRFLGGVVGASSPPPLPQTASEAANDESARPRPRPRSPTQVEHRKFPNDPSHSALSLYQPEETGARAISSPSTADLLLLAAPVDLAPARPIARATPGASASASRLLAQYSRVAPHRARRAKGGRRSRRPPCPSRFRRLRHRSTPVLCSLDPTQRLAAKGAGAGLLSTRARATRRAPWRARTHRPCVTAPPLPPRRRRLAPPPVDGSRRHERGRRSHGHARR